MTRLLLSVLCAAGLCASLAVTCFAADAVPATTPQKPLSGLSLLSPAIVPPAAPAPQAIVKIGVVDINRISLESAQGKAAQATMKEQQARLQKQVDAKKRQLEKMKADIERQLPALSPPQRQAKAREFQKKVEEMQKFGMNAEKGLRETQGKLTKELLHAIEQAAVTVAKQQRLTAVAVKGELLYLDANVAPNDISDDIVKLINATNAPK